MTKNNIHDWNVLIVEKRDYPMLTPQEFQVKSRTLLGAAMKAKRLIKKEYTGWLIHRIWWLKPDRSNRD